MRQNILGINSALHAGHPLATGIHVTMISSISSKT